MQLHDNFPIIAHRRKWFCFDSRAVWEKVARLVKLDWKTVKNGETKDNSPALGRSQKKLSDMEHGWCEGCDSCGRQRCVFSARARNSGGLAEIPWHFQSIERDDHCWEEKCSEAHWSVWTLCHNPTESCVCRKRLARSIRGVVDQMPWISQSGIHWKRPAGPAAQGILSVHQSLQHETLTVLWNWSWGGKDCEKAKDAAGVLSRLQRSAVLVFWRTPVVLLPSGVTTRGSRDIDHEVGWPDTLMYTRKKSWKRVWCQRVSKAGSTFLSDKRKNDWEDVFWFLRFDVLIFWCVDSWQRNAGPKATMKI